MLYNDNGLQSNLKFYYDGKELSIIVSFSYLDLVYIPGVCLAQLKVHLQFNINRHI